VVIIDDKIASAGTANMDLRSFMLNFEVNAFIYDEEVIRVMTDLLNSYIHLASTLIFEYNNE
ncbi:phospholipase D-like domain-containing protein, partial [Clostridioides difficile]